MSMHADANAHWLRMFSDPKAVSRYTEGPRQFVPGLDGLHRMAAVMLAEHAPADAHVLVLGAGGGMELKALAEAQPGWSFTGVDPACPMLALATRTLGPLVRRARLVIGTIDAAPAGPFDAATCLLTLHFLDRAERVRTLRELGRRMKPGAPLVVAHSSFPQAEPARSTWLKRYAAFAVASGAEPDQVAQARSTVASDLQLFAPEEDEAMLREAGFTAVQLFYTAFTWRGWIAHA